MFTKFKTSNITNIIHKNFSIFQKIRKFTKSAEYKSTEGLSSSKNPDDIKVEYDRPKQQNNPTKQFKSKTGLTSEELRVLKNLPKETISKFHK